MTPGNDLPPPQVTESGDQAPARVDTPQNTNVIVSQTEEAADASSIAQDSTKSIEVENMEVTNSGSSVPTPVSTVESMDSKTDAEPVEHMDTTDSATVLTPAGISATPNEAEAVSQSPAVAAAGGLTNIALTEAGVTPVVSDTFPLQDDAVQKLDEDTRDRMFSSGEEDEVEPPKVEVAQDIPEVSPVLQIHCISALTPEQIGSSTYIHNTRF